MSRHSIAALLLSALLVSAGSALTAQPAAPARAVFTAEELMADVTALAAPDMQGRAPETAGGAKAREWILERFRRAKLEPLGKDFQLPFSFERRSPGSTQGVKTEGVNLAGLCRGTGAKDKGALIITAHYDHLGMLNGATFHGADDNASGVTVLLALARQCQQSPWTHDAVFVAFDAEELGLQGARAFLAAPPLPKERLAVNVNMDMVARGDRNELYMAGTHHTPSLRTILNPVTSRSKIKALFGHDSGGGQNDWTTQSDHGVFHSAGIPFIYFGVEDHPDYHKVTDTADKINPTFFLQSASTILDAVTAIDRALPLPAK
jgi:Zn-dependent M28 family amino/carboxypeptidase